VRRRWTWRVAVRGQGEAEVTECCCCARPRERELLSRLVSSRLVSSRLVSSRLVSSLSFVTGSAPWEVEGGVRRRKRGVKPGGRVRLVEGGSVVETKGHFSVFSPLSSPSTQRNRCAFRAITGPAAAPAPLVPARRVGGWRPGEDRARHRAHAFPPPLFTLHSHARRRRGRFRHPGPGPPLAPHRPTHPVPGASPEPGWGAGDAGRPAGGPHAGDGGPVRVG